MVLLGASARVLGILEPDNLKAGIEAVFARKGEAVVQANISAFNAGFEESGKFSK